MEVQDASSNESLAKEVLVAYSEFLKTYPEAEINPELLFKSGEVFKGLGQYLQAAQSFNKVHYSFPNSKLAPLAMFQQADCFEALDQRLTAKHTFE